MATNATSKIDAAAEKAYAEAAAKEAAAKTGTETTASKNAAKPAPAKKVVKAAPKKAAPRKTAAKKVAPKKTAAKKTVTKKTAAKKVAPKKAAKKVTKKAATPAKTNPVIQLKDTIMAKANTNDFAKSAKEMAADVQTRAKTAYAKTGELASEVTEFSKGNVEAVVESGKILFAGVQELGREDVENGKSAIETVTADMKKIAAVQSPTEFMQLQGELARRNFDAAIAFGSKRSEALVKLYNDAFAPISNRVSLAAEKVKKAA